MERRHKREDRHRQGRDLSDNRDRGGCSPGRFPKAKIKSDAAIGAAGINQTLFVIQEFILLRRSSWSTLVLRKWRDYDNHARPTAASAAAMAMARSRPSCRSAAPVADQIAKTR